MYSIQGFLTWQSKLLMKYQFGRLQQTQKIFDEFEQSTKSCPQIFSIGNKVRPPKFLQK